MIAARLRTSAVGQQLVRRGVDLAGDEDERLVGDQRNVVGHEPQEPQRAQRHGEPEPVLGPALVKDQDAVAIGQREAGTQILDRDAVRKALKPPVLCVVRIPHPAPLGRGQ